MNTLSTRKLDNIMRKIKNYFKGVGIEARRVRWPKKKQLWISVGTVCIIAIVAALIIFFEDWIVAQMLNGFNAIKSDSSSSSAA
jgi:preprotein translocase SecE subunit